MMRWMKNSKKGMAVLGAVAFMMVAGWQFGVSGTEAVFPKTEVALEKAIEGSGGCSDWVCCQAFLQNEGCIDEEGNAWYGDEKRCGTDSCS